MFHVLCFLFAWPVFGGSADPLRISIFETHHGLHPVDALPLNHNGNRDARRVENETLQSGERRSWFINGTSCSAQRSYIHVELWDLDQVAFPERTHREFSDLIVILAKGQIPEVSLSAHGSFIFRPPLRRGDASFGSQYDSRVWLMMRAYHHVYLPTSMDVTLDEKSDNWYMTVYNIKTWMQIPLRHFAVRATCLDHAPCPSPLPTAPPCTQHGICEQGDLRSGCRCEEGWGDDGCSVQLKILMSGDRHRVDALGLRQWHYFSFHVPSGVDSFFVELKRISGDPILFLKPSENTKGIRNELPSILDYPEFADAASLQTMSSRHHLSQAAAMNRSYDIAIYNNPGRIERMARFEVHVDVVRSPPLCPFNCSSHGSCSWTHDSASFECVCELGYVGRLCDRRLLEIKIGQPKCGELLPDDAVYFEWRLTDHQIEHLPATVELHVAIESDADTHPVLYARRNGLPNTTVYTHKYLSHYGPGGNLTFGLFNIDLFVHQSFRYTMELTPPKGSLAFRIFGLCVLVTTATSVLVLILFILKTLSRRIRRQRAHQEESIPEAVEENEHPVEMAANLLNGYERSIYCTPEENHSLSSNESGSLSVETSLSTAVWFSEGTCTICISDYIDGDVLVRLPCHHTFHEKCITQWFRRNTSCPICRESATVGVARESSVLHIEMTDQTGGPSSQN